MDKSRSSPQLSRATPAEPPCGRASRLARIVSESRRLRADRFGRRQEQGPASTHSASLFLSAGLLLSTGLRVCAGSRPFRGLARPPRTSPAIERDGPACRRGVETATAGPSASGAVGQDSASGHASVLGGGSSGCQRHIVDRAQESSKYSEVPRSLGAGARQDQAPPASGWRGRAGDPPSDLLGRALRPHPPVESAASSRVLPS